MNILGYFTLIKIGKSLPILINYRQRLANANNLELNRTLSDIGVCFEHFVIQEVMAYLAYNKKHHRLYYWRSKDYEVDLIIGDEVAIEIKFSRQVKEKFYLIGQFSSQGRNDIFEYYPYADFFKKLWRHEII